MAVCNESEGEGTSSLFDGLLLLEEEEASNRSPAVDTPKAAATNDECKPTRREKKAAYLSKKATQRTLDEKNGTTQKVISKRLLEAAPITTDVALRIHTRLQSALQSFTNRSFAALRCGVIDMPPILLLADESVALQQTAAEKQTPDAAGRAAKVEAPDSSSSSSSGGETAHTSLVAYDRVEMFEFLCCYLLIHLQQRLPRAWLASRLSPPLSLPTPAHPCIRDCASTSHALRSLFSIPELEFTEYERNKIGRALKTNNGQHSTASAENCTLLDLLCNFSFRLVPTYVNISLLNLYSGNRLYELHFDVPEPLEVLEMQSRGVRCVSSLVRLEQLPLLFDEKDTLEFALHDLKHMEKFQEFYVEQVGFYHRMYAIHSHFAHYFSAYTEEFQHDFDYLISDMNSCALHLIHYLKAKWIHAERKRRILLLVAQEKQRTHDAYEQSKGNTTAPDDVDSFEDVERHFGRLNLRQEEEFYQRMKSFFVLLYSEDTEIITEGLVLPPVSSDGISSKAMKQKWRRRDAVDKDGISQDITSTQRGNFDAEELSMLSLEEAHQSRAIRVYFHSIGMRHLRCLLLAWRQRKS